MADGRGAGAVGTPGNTSHHSLILLDVVLMTRRPANAVNHVLRSRYEKLGARVVPIENIVNSSGNFASNLQLLVIYRPNFDRLLVFSASDRLDGGRAVDYRGLPPRAFGDLVAMIYPADAAWEDEGIVDLMERGW